MTLFKNFEEIIAWQKARMLTKEIYNVTNQHHLNKDFGLRDQMRRASVSIMSNIAEGFDRKSKKEFIYFLYISKGSASELRSQVYILRDLNYIDSEQYYDLINLCLEVSKMLSGLISYLKSK
jgi:four helix bundle protein